MTRAQLTAALAGGLMAITGVGAYNAGQELTTGGADAGVVVELPDPVFIADDAQGRHVVATWPESFRTDRIVRYEVHRTIDGVDTVCFTLGFPETTPPADVVRRAGETLWYAPGESPPPEEPGAPE